MFYHQRHPVSHVASNDKDLISGRREPNFLPHSHLPLRSAATKTTAAANPTPPARREEDSERFTICGTPNYMAPEVQGAGYGLSADLWAAGCLFYAMVTGGAPPFQGRRVGDTLANARAGRYAIPEGLSDAARDFLACLLSKVRCDVS